VTRRDVVGADTKDPMDVVTVEGRTPIGRTDESTKYVPLTDTRGRLTGKNLANAYAKAETGAKRRLVMSMVGLSSPPDPDEVRGARVVVVDGTGRVLDNPTEQQKMIAADPEMARVLREPTYETTAQAADGPLSGHASQAPTIEEIDPPKQPRRDVSLRCDANKWRAAYFGATADTALETAEGRRQFLASYTATYTPALRTDSLSDFLKRATDRQAEEMVRTAENEARALRDEARDFAAVNGEVIDGDEQPEIDEDAQYQADMLAELERDRSATPGAAF
jgi:hypothetical protein